DGERLRPLGRDRLGGGGEILLGRGREHGLRTLARECERHAAADSAASPRNDDDLALKLASHVPSSMLAVDTVLYARNRRANGAAKKSISIDGKTQLALVSARVQRPDAPPIAVNGDPFQSADLPRLLAGYDVCLDDHSYMPTEVMAQCRGLKHIVFLG